MHRAKGGSKLSETNTSHSLSWNTRKKYNDAGADAGDELFSPTALEPQIESNRELIGNFWDFWEERSASQLPVVRGRQGSAKVAAAAKAYTPAAAPASAADDAFSCSFASAAVAPSVAPAIAPLLDLSPEALVSTPSGPAEHAAALAGGPLGSLAASEPQQAPLASTVAIPATDSPMGRETLWA